MDNQTSIDKVEILTPNNKNTMKKTLVVSIIVGLVALAAGYAIGMKLGNDGATAEYNNKLEQLKKSSSQAEVKAISGTVKSVNGNTLTVETTSLGNLFDVAPQVREVTVGTNTKIIKREPMGQADFQKLQETYRLLGYSVSTPVRQVNASISDIKTGDRVAITSGQDIKTNSSFKATEIVIMLVSTVSVPSSIPATSTVPPSPVVPSPKAQ